MKKERLIGWSCGIIVLLLIIMIGKSCTNPVTPQQKNTTTSSTSASQSADSGYNIVFPTDPIQTELPTVGYDIFGKPIYATAPPSEDITEVAEEASTEAFTDIFGNAVEPSTEPVTDIFGNTVEPTAEETTLNEESTESDSVEAVEETQASTIPPGFSGYDHNKYDEEGNVVPTIPPDFVLIID